MKQRRDFPERVVTQNKGTKQDEPNHQKSIQSLAASLRAQRSKALEGNGVGEAIWADCVETARKELVKRIQIQQRRSIGVFCRQLFVLLCIKGLVVLLIVVLCIALFLYLYHPASFFLQRKLHSSIYPAARLARKGVLTLNPYLNAVGIDLFGSCIVKNPTVSDDRHCPTDKDIMEWARNSSTVPMDTIEAIKSGGKWWIIRDAFQIEPEVTVWHLHQFSVENSGILPHICTQIIGGGEDSNPTAFYTDIFDIKKTSKILKSPVPWSLSWIECPNENNTLTLLSLFPSPSYLPSGIHSSSMSLFSLSTEWCVSYHYHDELPSTLLNLAVVKGEVRVVPVAMEEDCQEEGFRFWENPILLKQGDAVLFDHHYWSYEVETWSNYSITITSSLLPSSEQT